MNFVEKTQTCLFVMAEKRRADMPFILKLKNKYKMWLNKFSGHLYGANLISSEFN